MDSEKQAITLDAFLDHLIGRLQRIANAMQTYRDAERQRALELEMQYAEIFRTIAYTWREFDTDSWEQLDPAGNLSPGQRTAAVLTMRMCAGQLERVADMILAGLHEDEFGEGGEP